MPPRATPVGQALQYGEGPRKPDQDIPDGTSNKDDIGWQENKRRAKGIPAQNNSDLVDDGGGTYVVPDTESPDTNQRTAHQDAQAGADVRGDPVPTSDVNLPEGLRRQRMGPYDKDTGRKG